jgi:homoserine dehydrogenase
LKFVLIGLGEVGRSLLSIMHEGNYQRPPGADEFRLTGVADSTGYASHPDCLDIASVLHSKKRGTISTLPNFCQNGSITELIGIAGADIVVDCMPTDYSACDSSFGIMLSAFRSGMHYVTAGKAVMATRMREALKAAQDSAVMLKFGATVGGGTPFLDFGRECLFPCRISALRGVLNGTTNFILSRMMEGAEQSIALGEARSLGLAEADASNDINGTDAAAKIVILANWLCGASLRLSDVEVRGIGELTNSDITEAERAGNVIRLIARFDGHASVSPETIPASDRLNVHGTLNALSYIIEGGDVVTLTGSGAGGRSTAYAVLRDMLLIRGSLQ